MRYFHCAETVMSMLPLMVSPQSLNVVTGNNGNDSELMKWGQKKHTVPSCANCRQTSDTKIPKT